MKREIEGDLRRKLTALRDFVTSDTEALLLADAESKIDSYIAASRQPQPLRGVAEASQDAAYGALDRLVTLNVQQSNAAQLDAARWNDVANVLGIGLGALVLTVVAALLVWLRRHAFAPIFGLASAMDRFGR